MYPVPELVTVHVVISPVLPSSPTIILTLRSTPLVPAGASSGTSKY